MPPRVVTGVTDFLVKKAGTSPLPLPADVNILVNEPGIVFNTADTKDTEWNLLFTLNQNFSVSVPSYEVFRPLQGLARDGNPVVRNDLRELQMFHDNAALNAVVLGRILMSQMYVFVNFDKGTISLGHVRPSDDRLSAVVPYIVFQDKQEQCDPQPRGLSGTAIGVIVVGVVLALLLVAIAVGIWWLRRKGLLPLGRRPRESEAGNSNAGPPVSQLSHPPPAIATATEVPTGQVEVPTGPVEAPVRANGKGIGPHTTGARRELDAVRSGSTASKNGNISLIERELSEYPSTDDNRRPSELDPTCTPISPTAGRFPDPTQPPGLTGSKMYPNELDQNFAWPPREKE